MSLCVVHHSGWSQTTAFPNVVHYSLYIGNDARGYSTPCDMYTDKDVSCTSCSTHMHAMSPDLTYSALAAAGNICTLIQSS